MNIGEAIRELTVEPIAWPQPASAPQQEPVPESEEVGT